MSFFDQETNEYDGRRPRARNREVEGHSGRRDVYTQQQTYGPAYSPAPYHSRPPSKGQQSAPIYSPPSDKPPIPGGWVPQWDDHYQRWFYHDTTTGRSQWEAPGYNPPREPALGSGNHSYDGADAYHSYGAGGNDSDKQRSGHGGMLLGAAGGLVAGALIANALHDDEDYRSYPQGAPAYADSVSSSDRESVGEARREYAEAVDDARSSSADSSDRERLEEAREEYYSEEEDAYGSD